MVGLSSQPAVSSPLPATPRITPARQYGAAILFALSGLVATTLIARQVERWADGKDRQRFEAECRRITTMIEQKMERYEAALSRLRDVCARADGRPSYDVWRHWLDFTLEVRSNFPNLLAIAVAARETPTEPSSPQAAPGPDAAPSRPRIALRPTQHEVFAGLPRETFGSDLAVETATHPDFSTLLQRTFGGIDTRVWAIPRGDGARTRGFWFAITLRPDDPGPYPAWRLEHEIEEQAGRRRERHLIDTASGILVAFVGGQEFLDEFNRAPDRALVAVQLHTSTNTVPESLLNPAHPFPTEPRFTFEAIMAWYSRRWTARFASTPLFEAQSLRYRATLVWMLGIPLSLAGAAALAWQTRQRWLQADLAEQLRLALARQERLSRDLHDGTLQSVYAIGLAIQRTRRLLDRDPTKAGKPLTETTAAVQRVIEELRAFVREADPASRAEIELGEALRGVVEHLRPATEMTLELEVESGADTGLAPGQALQLLNIAREAISNGVRHSCARRLIIRLLRASGHVQLVVEDDGIGFDPAEAEAHGHGLRNLAARVSELGGRHGLESEKGRGTRLVVEIPLAST